MEWLLSNLGTIVVSLILIAVVALAVRTLIRNRKNGRSCCGTSCSGCAGNCSQMEVPERFKVKKK